MISNQWQEDIEIYEEIKDFVRPQNFYDNDNLFDWNDNFTISAESKTTNVWELTINRQDHWTARKWHRISSSRYVWDQGDLEKLKSIRECHTNQFKIDQYDFFVKETIRILNWDPVLFWPKGRYHQNHKIIGVSDGQNILTFTGHFLYLSKIDLRTLRWTIKAREPIARFDRPTTKILDQLGFYNYEM